MLIAFMTRVAGAAVTDYVRQALSTFGVDGLANTPRSTGTTACDIDGHALMGRTVNAGKASTAPTGAGEEALAAYAARDEAYVQNVDVDGGGYLLVWLEGLPTVKSVLAPLGTFTWKGADRILVAGRDGGTPYVAVDR